AKELNRPEDYELFMKRAQNYKNIFDPETGFMRAKSNETWFSPFDPREVNFNYTEANSWQYSLYVPQDVTGLMKIMGGPDKLSQHLDHLFTADSKTSGRHQSDITGLIGQYAHGNEPSHHMAYLYNYTGEPWKTQEVVRRILDELYSSKPDGLCGNEDCGQMSAWYVLSAMGFYPVTPGSNMYAIGSPVFEKTTIHLGNGKEFIIEAKNVSDENKYIQTATLNGKVYPNSFLTHQQIMNGGFLSFEMGSRPSKNWGMQDGEIPVSEITEYLITPVPFVKNGNKVFHDDQDVEFGCADPDAKIFFTVSKGNSVGKEVEYVKPIKINKTTTFKVKARSENRAESYEVEPAFLKIPDGRSIRITNAYANQYSAGGDIALIDFQHGGTNFRTGLWQGYEGVDLDVVIDLGKSEVIQRLSTGFLEDINAWIFMPEYVDYFYSADGRKYIQLGRVENTVEPDEWNAQIRDFTLYFDVISARYIKVIGKNRGVCPSWHKGAGNQSWIFADEVAID
nr:glycoside hydrolase family 92 protein [Bacteroidota bacterium]